MSRPIIVALTIARFGVYLSLFVQEVLPQGPSPLARLMVTATVIALLITGYLLTGDRTSPESKPLLLGVELGLVFTLGVFSPRLFPYAYFVAVADAFFFLSLGRALIAAAAATVLLGANFEVFTRGRTGAAGFVDFMLPSVTGLVFVAAASRATVEQMAARRQSERLLKELDAAHVQLKAYAAEVETFAAIRERQRLAQEVHDSVAHVLTGVLIQLQAARRLLRVDPGAVPSRLAALEDTLRGGLDEIRRAVRAMRPHPLEVAGGPEAMRHLCHEFAERTGIHVHFGAEGGLHLTSAQEVLLYRALQECLTNAARHGRASTVWAVLRPRDGRAELRVRDDGAGARDVALGMGLAGIQDRAESAGGRVSYRTAPGEGFEVVLDLPGVPAGRTGTGAQS